METLNQNTVFSSIFWETYHSAKEHLSRDTIYKYIHSLPDGNEIPIFMIPGLGTKSDSLSYPKDILKKKGFIVETADIGYNWGPQKNKSVEAKIVTSFLAFIKKYGRARVVGHSIGGAAALGLARYHKEVEMVVTLAGAHGIDAIQPTLQKIFKIVVGRTPEDAWKEAVRRKIHSIEHIPVFHIIGMQDLFLGESVTVMKGNHPNHVFPINTSHGGLLKSRKATATLTTLLAMNL